MDQLIAILGEEVEDAEEEVFLLFSQQIPSQNLGFVDPKAKTLEITVAGRDVTIHQSPGLLESNRIEGTTGAVLWKITPLFASWISSPHNLLARCGVLSQEATCLEVGCGISGLVSLALASKVKKYVNTDQEYVLQLVQQNVEENIELFAPRTSHRPSRHSQTKHSKKAALKSQGMHIDHAIGNILVKPLDWETSDISGIYRDIGIEHLDIIISCDCIYNETLIEPLNTTLRDISRLASKPGKSTLVVVAQQLRAPDVLEAWLQSFMRSFRVWRVPDEELDTGLNEGSGYVVHVGMLRS